MIHSKTIQNKYLKNTMIKIRPMLKYKIQQEEQCKKAKGNKN